VNDLLSTLNSWLDSGNNVVSATIATSEGSTPRTAGSKMLVLAGGKMAGTVGGGLVEAQVLREAARVHAEGGARLLDFDLTGELAAGADMICGGKLRVFLERIVPAADSAFFRELGACIAKGGRCLALTSLDTAARTLLGPREVLAGAQLPPEVMETALAESSGIQAPILLQTLEGRWFLEPWAAPAPLFIAGAGHVSRPTAQLASMVGFSVTVLDDRPDFANNTRFPWAQSIVVTPDMGNCLDGFSLGNDASLVIVTRGHVHDGTVLAKALGTDAGYIGMIGSRRKRDAIYARLRQDGFTDGDIARVHCPVGLDIGAETPEEIAVSILAELIQERAKRRGG